MIKEYSLNDDIKRQLGLIIKGTRLFCFNQSELKDNSYGKANFCKGLCHVNTLSKLEAGYECGDLYYFLFLDKLNLIFVPDKHNQNMTVLDEICKDLLHSMEYIDNQKTKALYDKATQADFSDDCIAIIHRKLIELVYRLQSLNKIDQAFVEELKYFEPLFTGIYKGLWKQCLGIINNNNYKLAEAEKLFLEARLIYEQNQVGQGIINIYLISVYSLSNRKFDVFKLCKILEDYYLESGNENRLVQVYSYLSDYYINIHNKSMGERYFHRAIAYVEKNQVMKRYGLYIKYNWSSYCFYEGFYEEGIKYKIEALNECTDCPYKLKIYVFLLFMYTKLGYPMTEISKMIEMASINENTGNADDQTFYKYFKYKYDNPSFFRKYAIEKVIPELKQHPTLIDFLLIVYQDLYE